MIASLKVSLGARTEFVGLHCVVVVVVALG